MIDIAKKELWFVVGSQVLYGEEVLRQVEANGRTIVAHLDGQDEIPVAVMFGGVVKSRAEISAVMARANASAECVGLILWMHTFSPAKMWIAGLQALRKPFLHLHTQFNRDIPWSTIDMDFMNLNQSAHGDREFGFICTRLGLKRKVVVGHWASELVIGKIGDWSRVACAIDDQKQLVVARIGDNMREVAVTEGDKVAAQETFGYAVHGYGVGDVVACIRAASDDEVDAVVARYHDLYAVNAELDVSGDRREALMECGRMEAGLRRFLTEREAHAFTDTFENLHGLNQLPGLPVQQLMSEGFGFGAEGDWKTAALVRAMKVMGSGLPGGCSFMEDYTYHFEPDNNLVLGAHMLEICPSICASKPEVQIHPLSIGGKADPVRLVFDAAAGPAVMVCVVDLGDRFRMVMNRVEVVDIPEAMPLLPVARALWRVEPSLEVAAEEWILAGGSHHSCFCQRTSLEMMRDFAEELNVEF